jgi:eukaryotic-like serine/threonine-protein kinase
VNRSGTASDAERRLGRFRLLRVLGRGAQATVWLAHDPRLDREVAIKRIDLDSLAAPAAGGAAVHEWLAEARAVSRLTHPNIVPVFEADEADGQPYLVFEYVEGRTLAEARRGRGPMAPRDAAALLLGVLDALAAAHAAGIVHRDLKPSNVLLGSDGRARVMDFGIAARVAPVRDGPGNGPGNGRDGGRIVGTPGYMSPEAARGDAPAPAMDLFAAGLLLAELLAGAPLVAERDPWHAVHRVRHEDLRLPAAAAVDDVLRGIVQRALAREPQQRCDSARAMRDALAAWLEPASDADAAAAAGAGTIEFLLRRMRHKSDFPALSASVVRIQQMAASDTESLASLSAEILKDVALTNKLLRVVNTAQYGHAAHGGISTVSRAVAMVGFAGIRNMALSLLLLEHMQDKAHAALLQEEFLRALMAATLTAGLSPAGIDREDAFLGALLQNLGRLLAEYYFPDEARQIRQRVDAAPAQGDAADAAARSVLGITLCELGLGVARSWGLPDSLQRVMRLPEGPLPARRVAPGVELQRWLGRVAGQATDLMLAHDGDVLAQRLALLGGVCGPALGVSMPQLLAAVQDARESLGSLAVAMGLHTAPGSRSRRLLAPGSAALRDVTDSLAPHRLLPAPAEAPATPPGAAAPAAADVLAAGIQDITQSMVAENVRLNEVLRMVLESIYRALALRRVVFCLREPRGEVLTGRFGLGDGVDAMCKAFRVPLRPDVPPDVFSAVVAKGMDTLIQDARSASVVRRLPAWYAPHGNVASFLLLPMASKGVTFALIYADTTNPGGLAIGERELSLVRTLRNQALMAFRQAERAAG